MSGNLLSETREALARIEAKLERLVSVESRLVEHEISDATIHSTLGTQVKWLWTCLTAAVAAWIGGVFK